MTSRNHARPLLVYLDQSYWGRITTTHTTVFHALVAGVEAGSLVVPFYVVPWMETMKAAPHVREKLLESFEALSGRYVIEPDVRKLLHLELQRHREGRDARWVGERLVISDTQLLQLLRITLDPVVQSATEQMLGMSLSQLIREKVDSIFEEGAPEATAISKQTPTSYSRSEIAKVMELPESDLPPENGGWRTVFRSIAVRDALQRSIVRVKPGGLEPNDLADLQFLWITLPYFDVVTVDRAMGARIREAALGDLQRATVVQKIDDLPAIIETQLQTAQ